MTLLAERRPELEPRRRTPGSRRGARCWPARSWPRSRSSWRWATQAADVPLRDPDHVAALYFVMVAAARGDGEARHHVRAGAAGVCGRRARRCATCGASAGPARAASRSPAAPRLLPQLRGLPEPEGVVPLLRPDTLFDRQLANLDRDLFFGHDPAVLLHSLLGTGISAQVLSSGYVVFIVFLPLSLALALVFSPNLRGRPVLRDGAVDQLADRRRELLPAAVAGPDLLRPGHVRRPAPLRGHASPGRAARPARRVPRPPGDGTRPGDRRLRVAARLDEPDRGAGRPPPRARPADEDRALGLARADHRSTPSTSAGTTSSTTSAGSPSRSSRSCSRARDRADQPRASLR